MKKEIINQLKETLEKEREKLIQQLSTFAKKDPRVKGDWDTIFPKYTDTYSGKDEAAEEVEEYSNRLPAEYALELRLLAIEEALEKIKKNTYGKCEKCGQEIEIERLKICPEAKTCLQCKEK